jgi:hypothetical protein
MPCGDRSIVRVQHVKAPFRPPRKERWAGAGRFVGTVMPAGDAFRFIITREIFRAAMPPTRLMPTHPIKPGKLGPG